MSLTPKLGERGRFAKVSGFDLATLYEYINEDSNQRIEEKAHSLVKQLASFRNKLKT